jgi:hypothetical protein
MKYVPVLLLLIFIASCQAQKKRFDITVTYTQPYCGGARPTEEMTREAEKARPYAKRSLIFVSEKSKVDSAKTDENGFLTLKLKKGTYLFYETWRYYLYTPENLPIEEFDRECLKTEWQKPLCKVSVTKEEVKITGLNAITKFCPWNVPCIRNNPQIPE